jgi:hypothetical protein
MRSLPQSGGRCAKSHASRFECDCRRTASLGHCNIRAACRRIAPKRCRARIQTYGLPRPRTSGDDWLLHKPGTKEHQLADDYSKCHLSTSAPPMIDSRTNQVTTNPKLIEAHQRFVLSCMGAKGYVCAGATAR